MTQHTARLLEFLSNPANYPHRPAEVRRIQTHASWVFLAPPYAWKIKQPVNFGFLDFSTLALRHADCEREVLLNRRLAPDVYLGVEAIRDVNGTLHFGDSGEVVEWAVKMRALDSANFLSHRLTSGTAGTADIDRIATTLCAFYTAQPPLPAAEAARFPDHLKLATEGNFQVARAWTGRTLTPLCLAALEAYTARFYHTQQPLLTARVQGGWVRDCHGDLHSEHIHLEPDAVRIYDCIEFNTRFRHIDVANDLAFLAMDLDFHGHPTLATRLIERCRPCLGPADQTSGRLLDFYKCYRASVRGKVESLHAATEPETTPEHARCLERARLYFRLALRYALCGTTPSAFVLMGRVASGKSSLAAALSRETGWVTAASDSLRKTLAGVPLHHRGDPAERAELYSPAMTRRTYEALADAAVTTLRAGQPIILDATFARRSQRDTFAEHLRQAGLTARWVEVAADPAVARGRLEARANQPDSVSDARAEDQDALDRAYEPPSELAAAGLLQVTTRGDLATSSRDLLITLAEANTSCHPDLRT